MASNVATFYSVWVTGDERGTCSSPLEFGGSEKRIEREIRQAGNRQYTTVSHLRNQNSNQGVVFAPFLLRSRFL
jgi:hypothetical protein